MDSIMVETLPLLGICSLCLAEGVVKSMILKESTDSNGETYTETLLKFFSIDIDLMMELDDTRCVICSICIKQLQACLKFKEQVLASLKTLEASARIKQADHSYEAIKDENNPINESNVISLENVKELATAMGLSKDNFVNADTDVKRIFFTNIKQECLDGSDFDDHILKDFIIKKNPDDFRPRCTKKKTISTSKKKVSYSVKKQADLKETERMLESGLFPFKMGKNHTYSCAICPEKSTILDDIKNHITGHNILNISVAFKKMIASNLQRFYKSSSKLRCKYCKNYIPDYDVLKHHINSCISANTNRFNNLPFKLEKDQLDCPICQKKFLNFISLNTHMNFHYPNHICDSCGKAFASKAR